MEIDIRRIFGLYLVVLVFMAILSLPVQADQYLPINAEKANVQLTEAQKKELATLNKEIFAKKKELISKYVEYGVMSKEKGDKIISKMEKRLEKLEQNDFVPPFKGKCREGKFKKEVE